MQPCRKCSCRRAGGCSSNIEASRGGVPFLMIVHAWHGVRLASLYGTRVRKVGPWVRGR